MSEQKLEGLLEPESESEIDRIRHSAAHIMAHAVEKLWPGAEFGIGPTIENGFYYDIRLDHTLTPEDLKKIEKEMKRIVKTNAPFVRKELSIPDAISFFKNKKQSFKVEIIENLRDQAGATSVSIYEEGDFVDLCRGPHVERARDIGHFKLLSIAGAYWRGNEKNPQLQRIYGTAFPTEAELTEHLHLLEEAKKRDHRKLGKELDLFSFHPEAPGSPFFHPKGALLYNLLQDYIRGLYKVMEYDEIITPQIMDIDLWKKSGHYENYKENMYFTEVDEREFAVKPMNCPASTFVYASTRRSYRDLPLRLADFGRLHRHERSGALHGVTRVRSFCQDDAHVFCTPDQIGSEIQKVVKMILKTYELFEFHEVKIFLSTRPEKRVGADALWDKAESMLEAVLEEMKHPYQVNHGDGAFYGPKIDFMVRDALKREFQLGTIQLDFSMPERFDLKFTNSNNEFDRPVMVHRAVLGSVERFIGILIEHVGGAFPFWLAPVQAVLIPIGSGHVEYCREFSKELQKHGIRVTIDDRNESLGLKTREAQISKIPFQLVAGDRDMEAGVFAVRKYGERQSENLGKAEILHKFMNLMEEPKKVAEALE